MSPVYEIKAAWHSDRALITVGLSVRLAEAYWCNEAHRHTLAR